MRPEPDAATVATGPPPGLAEADDIESAGDLAPFRAVRLLGRGGMGVVWLAEQMQPVQRLLALKVAQGPLSARLRGWFEVERHALARMRHPGIAQLLDAGELADGRPYFAMEYVEGVPITHWCGTTHPPLRTRVQLLKRIALAVQHAHGRGLVHRDLKPANLLVVEVDGQPQPKLIDFGVASAVAVRGAVAGTPGYMSPEQGAGDDQVDVRSDVYAFGIVMAEVLAGLAPQRTLPRQRRTVARWSDLEPAQRRAWAQSVGLPAARLERILRADLGPLIDACTEPDPALRLGSAQQVADELGRWLDGRPLALRRRDRWYVWRTQMRKHRWALLAATVFAGGLGTALALALHAQAEAERQRDAAVQAQAEADRQARNARQVNRFLTEDLLGAANLDEHPAAETLTVRQLVEDSAQRLLSSRNLEPEASADLLYALGRTLTALGRYPLAAQALEQSAARRAQQQGQHDPRVLLARVAAADARVEGSDLTAGAQLEALLPVITSLQPSNPALLALCEYALSRHLTYVGDYERAYRLARDAVGRAGLDARQRYRLREQLAWTLSRTSRHDEAIALQRELLDEALRIYGEDSWPALNARGALASSQQRAGQLAAARVERETVLAAMAIRFPTHSRRGVQHSHYASLLLSLQRPREAETSARTAIELLSGHYGAAHRVLANAWSHLGAALSAQGRTAEAQQALEQADRIYRAELPAEHPLRQSNDQRLEAARRAAVQH